MASPLRIVNARFLGKSTSATDTLVPPILYFIWHSFAHMSTTGCGAFVTLSLIVWLHFRKHLLQVGHLYSFRHICQCLVVFYSKTVRYPSVFNPPNTVHGILMKYKCFLCGIPKARKTCKSWYNSEITRQKPTKPARLWKPRGRNYSSMYK